MSRLSDKEIEEILARLENDGEKIEAMNAALARARAGLRLAGLEATEPDAPLPKRQIAGSDERAFRILIKSGETIFALGRHKGRRQWVVKGKGGRLRFLLAMLVACALLSVEKGGANVQRPTSDKK